MDSARLLQRNHQEAVAYWHWTAPGSGRVLVLLHGLASNHTRWSEFLANTRLKESWNILRVDLRGHGASQPRGRIDTDVWCEDLRAILDREGYGRAVLAGHCLGANIAIHFAHREPARTAGLVLVEPMLPAALAGTLRRATRFEPLLRAVILLIRAANALGLKRRRFPPLDLERLDRETRAKIAASGSHEALLKRYAAPLHDLKIMPSASFFQALLEVKRELPPLETITAPTLTLLSAGTTFSDIPRTQELLRALPDHKTVILDAHHWIPMEQPDRMRAEIEEWCAARFS
jgi:esterase